MFKRVPAGVCLVMVVACTPAHPPAQNSSLEGLVLRQAWAALASRPDTSPEARLVRAHALLALNRNNEATCVLVDTSAESDRTRWLAWTRQFTKDHADAAVAHYLYGDALARTGQWTEAAAALTEALALNPKDYLALNARGVVRALSNDIDDARLDFNEAVTTKSDFAEAHASTAYLLVQTRGPAAAAAAAFERALALSPHYSLAAHGRAYLEVLDGRSGAFDAVRQAVDANPCAAPIAGTDLTRLMAMLMESPARRGDASQPLGTTLRSDLSKALQSNKPSDWKKVVAYAAEHPESQKTIELSVKEAGRWNSKAGEGYGRAVNERVQRLEMAHRAAEVAQGVSVSAEFGKARETSGAIGGGARGVGAQLGGKAGGDVRIGVAMDGQKAFSGLKNDIQQKLVATKELQKASPAAQNQQGGVSTSLASVRFDDGEWPRIAHYGLLYDARDPRERR